MMPSIVDIQLKTRSPPQSQLLQRLNVHVNCHFKKAPFISECHHSGLTSYNAAFSRKFSYAPFVVNIVFHLLNESSPLPLISAKTLAERSLPDGIVTNLSTLERN